MSHHARMNSFDILELIAPLKVAVAQANYLTMTPIQAASLPPILAGRDVIGQAKTGSGKTAAFALGLLNRLDPALVSVQALILSPTRELATQVSNEVRKLAAALPNVKVLTLCGGVSLRPHLQSLKHLPQAVVGTPGRILELIEAAALPLDKLQTLVLDEADRLLDMGFADEVRAILKHLPATRQTLLFSATYPDAVRRLSRDIQRDPMEVTVSSTLTEDDIEQRFYEVAAEQKFAALMRLLNQHEAGSVAVFCAQRVDARAVADQLRKQGVVALALHGDLDQRERDEVLVRFANRSATVLVATDLAARGLDIQHLDLVINYDLASDADAHLHRIGRTGRAGRKGLALSLVMPHENARAVLFAGPIGEGALASKLPSPKPAPLPAPAFVTLQIDGGRSDKLRAGDILGALTGSAGLPGDGVGKIDIFPTRSYVAVARDHADAALRSLGTARIKNLKLRVRRL